jgi:hypothetical protein
MRRKNLFFAMTTSYANKADGQVNQCESPAPGKITILNRIQTCANPLYRRREIGRISTDASVAQLDRASDFGSEGWGFESLRMRQFYQGFKEFPGVSQQRSSSIFASAKRFHNLSFVKGFV